MKTLDAGSLVSTLLLGLLSAPAGAQLNGIPLHLPGGPFIPSAGTDGIRSDPTLPSHAQEQRHDYLVQFSGPVRQAWKDAVTAAGAELLDYIPDFAFKARMNSAQAARVTQLDPVAWMGRYQPGYKFDRTPLEDEPRLYRVRMEHGANGNEVQAAIARNGAEILIRDDPDGGILLVGASPVQVAAIAGLTDIAWIERYVMPETQNEYGAGQIVGSAVANANGYDGSTQQVAVADTGLGGGTAETAHPDIPAGRIDAIYNWPGQRNVCFRRIADDGALDVDSGHGTHVSGTVLSAGGPAGEGTGAAPAAHLIFQAIENWAKVSNYCQSTGDAPAAGYFLIGLPDDLHQLYRQAYEAGARVHSNSWGSAMAGEYTINSRNTDDFIWTHPEMTIVFAAGNEGVDADADGVVDRSSIGSPATAKNVIAVGASEGDRQGDYACDTTLIYNSHDVYQPDETCRSMGGQNILGTAGVRWGFPADPLKNDETAGNAGQMAPFSSRGPTNDGRIKPDVVAPGTWILSAYSGLYQEGYGSAVNPVNGSYQSDSWGIPFSSTHKYMGGTSMAAPIVAGSSAVVRDFYVKAHAHAASAALVKATLINSAVDLLDENNDGVDDNRYSIPNLHEGWGLIDLVHATDDSALFFDVSAGLSTLGADPYCFDVTEGTTLKVTLVWSDYAASENATVNLVNDLDLAVTAPRDQARYLGNVFSAGWSQTGGRADRRNNVENVYIQSATPGAWMVEVNGYNVPYGPQPYALVVDGGTLCK